MTTKLDSPVTRETSLEIRGRPVNVTLDPGDAAIAAPTSIELHLKGTQQRKRIPLEILLHAVWPEHAPKPQPIERGRPGLDFDLDELARALAPYKAATS